VRLLLEGPGGGFFTTDAAFLPAAGGWQRARFRLRPELLAGSGVVEATLSGVTKLRLLHAPSVAGAEAVSGALGVDEVTALGTSACEGYELEAGALGLCRAYCDALRCAEDEGAPHGRACESLGAAYRRRTGELPPCEPRDADGDGVLDELDNCATTANAEQTDTDGDGPGDACDNCPADSNPGQEDGWGTPGVGDLCDCPCFTSLEVAALLGRLRESSVYQTPVCVDTRISTKPLTFVAARRLDGGPCATRTVECSALAVEFTEDDVCQWNPPSPETPVAVQGIGPRRREACRAWILEAAQAAGLPCN
jgi:hypothetical protein